MLQMEAMDQNSSSAVSVSSLERKLDSLGTFEQWQIVLQIEVIDHNSLIQPK